jgi:transposase
LQLSQKVINCCFLLDQNKGQQMELKNVVTQNLDHLGLIASIAKELGIVERIDKRLEKDQASVHVSMGQRALALIINGLGFTDERLYMVSQFFRNKPVARLIGEKVQAEHLNDDALARLLDAIYAYGTTKLYGEIAFEIGQERGLLGKSAHLDTTSLSLQGEYVPEDQNAEAVQIMYGYSKDKRFDLKQVMLSLTSSGQAGFPLWMEALDGNASDKKSLHASIEKMRKFSLELKASVEFTWVADSALYTADKLLAAEGLKWITRVPETIKAARELSMLAEAEITWEDLDKGYRVHEVASNYGGMEQRWLLVHSDQAYKREKKTFDRRVAKEEEGLKKAIWHLGNDIFSCEKDAMKAVKLLQKKYRYHEIKARVEPVEKFSGRGRPKSGSQKVMIGFCIKALIEKNETEIAETLNRKGRFILATNELDHSLLSNESVLREYKAQSQVERGFRFIKDPWFMVDSIFLKKNERIEALMVIMTLCLMVYNVGEYHLREQLQKADETLPNQLGKEIKNPTLRWIFKLMQGISVVRIYTNEVKNIYQEAVSNICELTRRIICYFGKYALEIYGLSAT